MTYRIEVTHQYLRDLKLARKRHLDESKLNDIISLLASGKKLPPKNRDHSLSSNFNGCRECHITPDWLLIYRINDTFQILSLVRTGSHSDLF